MEQEGKMYKEVVFNNKKFKIKIKLFIHEHGQMLLKGREYHLVTVKELGGSIYRKIYEIDTEKNIEDELMKIETITAKYAKKDIPKIKQILLTLGYTN